MTEEGTSKTLEDPSVWEETVSIASNSYYYFDIGTQY